MAASWPLVRPTLRDSIIIQFGESTIANSDDDSYALDAVKVDEPLKVVFLRDGERLEAIMTPTTGDCLRRRLRAGTWAFSAWSLLGDAGGASPRAAGAWRPQAAWRARAGHR